MQRNIEVSPEAWEQIRLEAGKLGKNVRDFAGDLLSFSVKESVILLARHEKQLVRMKVVYAYVCGDILHEGHILHLTNAKALGDKLIVGVLTDAAIMEKKTKPTIPFHERLRVVQSLSCVDCAVAQDTYSPLKNVMSMKPDILAESVSHNEQPANEFMEEIGGRVVTFPYYPAQSSSKIKEKVKHEREDA